MDEEMRKLTEDQVKESREYRFLGIMILAMIAGLLIAVLLNQYLKDPDLDAERRLRESMEAR